MSGAADRLKDQLDAPSRPALTAEEWAGLESGPDRYGGDSGVVYVAERDGSLRIALAGASYEIDRRHEVAALALHGQTFGFTRVMVDAVRTLVYRSGPGCCPKCAGDMRGGDGRRGHPDEVVRCSECEWRPMDLGMVRTFAGQAADRIEAMLPPGPA